MAPPAVTAIAPNTDPITNDLFMTSSTQPVFSHPRILVAHAQNSAACVSLRSTGRSVVYRRHKKRPRASRGGEARGKGAGGKEQATDRAGQLLSAPWLTQALT